MANLMATFCDRHLVDQVRVEATLTRIAVNDRTVEVDLCEDCRTELLGEVFKLMDEHEQSVESEARENAEPSAAVETSRGSESKQTFACPDCERDFSNPQGVGAHRARVHGYVSPTKSQREKRQKRQRKQKQAA